ncbi:hypothetical protein K376_01321 [Streptomyces sp. PsTaAH-130]|nr:hypothetical protein K376_01321 [Streptomyces sp. PsTaAH-130]
MRRCLTPRLATAVFRHYLRPCVTAGPDRSLLLTVALPETALPAQTAFLEAHDSPDPRQRPAG